TPKPLAGTFTADNKVYDATRAATVGAKSLPDVISGDDVTLSVANVLFDTKNVGIGKDVTGSLSLTGDDAGNYTVNGPDTTKASITPAGLTGSFTANDKIYDATPAATVKGKSLAGVLGSDDVILNVTNVVFANKNVGTDKAVTGDLSLSGNDAGNYTVNGTDTTKANITPKPLTGAFTADSKVYDATRTATVKGKSLPGVIGADDVTLNVTNVLFDTKNVGTDKDVTGSLSLSGGDA